ncbi:MAG: ACP S-malonyltransferase [Acidimicrobiia bacterium]|nr:ACP S-malonyltransferase [Acidimicrobiia bacterium]MCY4458407.1 ACP S-malonyltransferase [Acidimicrobiaceae bacterium]
MIVFTYPGQGSQRPQMGASWAQHPSWELVDEASQAADRDVAALLLDADTAELTKTSNAQLATFVMSMVVLDAVSRLGVEAVAHAGHSLGEYSALTAAGALEFGDAVRLVNERGDAMQAAADEQTGTMAALLGLSDEQADIACRRTAGDVWIANYNAPGQVVIAGVPQDIDQAIAIAKAAGAKRAMRLEVGGAFHTPLMAPAKNRLRKAIDQVEFRPPEQPVYANVDATAHQNRAEWPELLGAQLCSPVRWCQTLNQLGNDGFNTFIELGPGNVLSGLVKRTLKSVNRAKVATPADLDNLLESLATKIRNEPTTLEGEHLFATERLVVSPAAGIFSLAAGCEPGQQVAVGDILGTVGEQAVLSSFAGEIIGVLALKGERVMSRQPIAWLRVP